MISRVAGQVSDRFHNSFINVTGYFESKLRQFIFVQRETIRISLVLGGERLLKSPVLSSVTDTDENSDETGNYTEDRQKTQRIISNCHSDIFF